MSSRDALILFLPEAAELPPRWMRVIDGALVQSGEGANWLAACGIAALPEQARVLLVPPAPLGVQLGRSPCRVDVHAAGDHDECDSDDECQLDLVFCGGGEGREGLGSSRQNGR